MSSYACTKEEPKVGGHYQYQSDRITDFGEKELIEVELVKDQSDDKYYKHTFLNLETGKKFKIVQAKGDYYYGGMPRLWDEGEYSE
ncbi:MAG: hypothetical protein AAB922_00800 [Patescibacteria group bacterium]